MNLNLTEELYSLFPDPKWATLVKKAALYQDKRDDAGHAATVAYWASVLLDLPGYKADRETVLVAALLHDVGWSCVKQEDLLTLFRGLADPEERELRLLHEKEGAELASSLMEEAGYGASFIRAVAELVGGHDTRKGYLSPEDGLLRDADSLWMVTEEGFQADLRRRDLSPEKWASRLRKRFLQRGAFYTEEARIWGLRRLSRLEKGRRIGPPGVIEKSRVLICHYRVGWTDGVSLEIEKRQSILEEMGFQVSLLAGPGSRGADYTIPDLDFDTPEARKISRNAFGGLKDFSSEAELIEVINCLSDKIEDELSRIMDDLDPDFILLHNIFSHGRHIAAARAFCRCLVRYKRPSLATHHDFFWERDDFRNPSGPMVEGFLDQYVPPVIPGMKHAVINSLAARKLLNRSGIDALIFPDTLDFTLTRWKKDEYNSHLLEDFGLRADDIFILQATRIVRRKGIELIPPLIALLNRDKYLNQLRGKTLYNGKQVTGKSRFVFLIAGYAEKEAEDYRDELEDLMVRKAVPYRFLRSQIASERSEREGCKTYSLFDTYPYADLVSYPSIYEGWGNQFIEAVFAEKPVIVHEYPVFLSDIKPKGYQIISLGSDAQPGADNLYTLDDELMDRTCQAIVNWLLSPETAEKLERNFQLAEKNNSYDYLRSLMKQSMEHYEDY